MLKFIRDLSSHRHALTTLVQVNLKTTVSRTRLGYLWWIIDPLVMMVIYYFVVQMVFQRGVENYHIFILCGLITWQFFSRALTGTIRVIVNNQQLIRQIALPITMLVAIPVIVQSIFGIIGIVIIVAWNYQAAGLHTLGALPLLLLIGLFSFGLGLFLSVLNVFLDDINLLISYVLRVGFFLCPVLYPVEDIMNSAKIPFFIKQFYSLNPLTWIITDMRKVLLDGVWFSWKEYLIMLAVTLVIIQAGLYCVRSQTPRIIKML
ncbi:MAG: ABC transporter permease [Desulfobulbaceae bacterium]